MYIIFHWIFTIWYILQLSIEFSRFYTFNEFEFFNKFGLSVHLKYTIFPWISTILYFQWNQFSQQVRNICASNVLNFHDLVRSLIFYRIFTKFYIQQIWIFYKSKQSVLLMYIIFHWIFTISYFQCKQISQQVRTICTSNAHKFPLNFLDLIHYLIFHWISSNLYIQRIQIFLQIQTSFMSNAQNFQSFNFHDFVHSTNSNFFTNPTSL